MPPIELGPVRPTGAIDVRTAGTARARAVVSPEAISDEAAVRKEALEALKPGEPPVDAERVMQVRRALEEGTYPLLPAKVADAIIAAGIILRTTAHDN